VIRGLFLEEGNGYDAAMASLDLAHVYNQQGRTAELRQLAEELQLIFEAKDLHREARAALLLFQEAIRKERVTAKLIRELAAYLKRARLDPDLRFGGKG
jgi:hypothetical protein